METNTLIGGGVAIGLVTAFWNKVKFITGRIASLFVGTAHIEGDAAKAISIYCWSKLKRSPFGERRYSAVTEYVRPARRFLKVGYETIGQDPILFWDGWKPLLIGQQETTRNTEATSGSDMSITLTYLRFMFNTDTLLEQALDLLNKRYQESNGSRFCIYRVFGYTDDKDYANTEKGKKDNNIYRFTLGEKRVLKWKIEELGTKNDEAESLNNLSLSVEAEEMIDEIKFWIKSEQWYIQKGIQWKRGWLLVSPPGFGKSSLVRAIAKDLDIPIFSYDLATLLNKPLVDGWRNMLSSTPCIALFEDIDRVFDKDKNIVRTDFSGGLTFDCFINCLDGVENSNGVFIIITTNDIKKVDSALGGLNKNGMPPRPGRVDRVLELEKLTEEGRRKIANRILNDCTSAIEPIVKTGAQDTPAVFVERCRRQAEQKFWKSS